MELLSFTPDLHSALVLVVHGMATVINRRHVIACSVLRFGTEITKKPFFYWSFQVMIEVSIHLPAMDRKKHLWYMIYHILWRTFASTFGFPWIRNTVPRELKAHQVAAERKEMQRYRRVGTGTMCAHWICLSVCFSFPNFNYIFSPKTQYFLSKSQGKLVGKS